MQAVQLILVSTLLSYDKVIVTYPAGVTRISTGVPVSNSMNQSNVRFLANNNSSTSVRFKNPADHDHSNSINLKSENVLTPKINSSKNALHTSIEINNLENVVMNDTDNLNNADQNTKDIYENVQRLLLHKIYNCLTTKLDLNAISSYLGFPSRIIDLINAAFTQLLYEHRRGHINVSNLANAFFYSCDIEHMLDNDSNDIQNVKENFQKILEKFGFKMHFLNILKNYEENVLVNSLKESIKSISKHLNWSFSVTIPLMKNRQFVDESTNKTVNKLKARFIEEYQTSQAESYEKETDGNKITENHVNLIRKLIPDIFGFAYNHFELLTKFREYEIDEKEVTQAIKRFSLFLNIFMEIFIKRYFEFKNTTNKFEYDQRLLDDMYPLIDFINPEKAPKKPTISNLDYHNRVEKFDTHMWMLMNNALKTLLAVCEAEDIEEWKKNRPLKIDYPSENLTKDQLIKLINGNTEDAYDILGVFVADFVNGVELYKTYKLDIANWPEFIY